MSLINQMLQDLDARRASLENGAGATQEIRSLPPQRKPSPLSGLMLATVIALLCGAGLWWWSAAPASRSASAPSTAPMHPAPPPSAPASPAPVPAAHPPPSSTPTAPVQDTPTAASSETPGPGLERPAAASPCRPASSEAAKAASAPSAEQALPMRKEAPKPRSPERRESGLRVETALRAVPASAGTAGEDDARIEKKARLSTPRERAENEYRRAIAMVNQGRVQEALAVLRGALSEEPAHTASRLALFELLVEQRRLDEAQALMQESLTRNPLQPQLAAKLARLQLERDDAGGAEATLSHAAAAAADNAEFRAFRAAVLQRLTFHRDAVREYQAALRLAPRAGVWWMGLGISLEAEGKAGEAREAFQRARATGALTPELTVFVEQRLRQLQ